MAETLCNFNEKKLILRKQCDQYMKLSRGGPEKLHSFTCVDRNVFWLILGGWTQEVILLN